MILRRDLATIAALGDTPRTLAVAAARGTAALADHAYGGGFMMSHAPVEELRSVKRGRER